MDYETGYLQARDLADQIVEQAGTGKSVAGLGGARRRKMDVNADKYDLDQETSATSGSDFGALSVGSVADLFSEADQEAITALLKKMEKEAEGESSLRPVSRGDALNSEVGINLMKDLKEAYGLTTEQAAGIVGNLAHETGDFKFMQEIEPVVPGSKGGYGFAQWTGPRRRSFEKWAEENALDISSYEANLGYLMHEIDNTSEGRFMEDLKEAGSAEDAARIVSEQYLRPGKPNMQSRITKAYGYTELE